MARNRTDHEGYGSLDFSDLLEYGCEVPLCNKEHLPGRKILTIVRLPVRHQLREYFMPDCHHTWTMVNIQYGFTVFERCSHCQSVRTYFSEQDTWDNYQEGDCTYTIVENAQTIRFDLKCSRCQQTVSFADLLGLMYCTSCFDDCTIERIQQEYLKKREFTLVAFGYMPEALKTPIADSKLSVLADYFNQRRDTTRSRVKIVPFTQINKKISLCRGEFIHDVGMLSLEAPSERKELF